MLLLATTYALAQAAPVSTSYEQASNEVTVPCTILLQSGKDESACHDLAKTLVDELTSSAEQSNKVPGALDDGSPCPNKGQDAVTAAQNNRDNAAKAASNSDAAEAASEAADVSLNFGTLSFSTLNEGECGQFWKDESYVAAKATHESAAKAQIEADAKATATATALDEA